MKGLKRLPNSLQFASEIIKHFPDCSGDYQIFRREISRDKQNLGLPNILEVVQEITKYLGGCSSDDQSFVDCSRDYVGR